MDKTTEAMPEEENKDITSSLLKTSTYEVGPDSRIFKSTEWNLSSHHKDQLERSLQN